MNFSFDLIFSYWLDAWFIAWLISHMYDIGLYIPNPAVFLAIGLSQNWWFLSRMFYYGTQTKWLYLGQSILFKLLPLLYTIYVFPYVSWSSAGGLREVPSRFLTEIKRSWIFGLGLMAVYTLYLFLNGTDPVSLYSAMNKSILSGEIKTPFMRIAHYL